MNEHSIEVSVVSDTGPDKGIFRVLTAQEVKDYLEEAN